MFHASRWRFHDFNSFVKKRCLLGVIVVCLFTLLTNVIGAVEINAEEVNNNLFVLADDLYSKFMLERDKALIKDAYLLLLQLNEEKPDNFEIQWRLARVLNEYGAEEEKPLPHWNNGVIYAQKAIEINPARPEGYLWLAILKGSIGREQGIINSLQAARQMRDLLEIVTTIEPDNAYAYNILATLYRLVPNPPLSFGNKKTALELAQTAVDLVPDSPWLLWNLYEAKISYGKGLNREEIITLLEIIISLPNYEPFAHLYRQPFPKEVKKDAQEALKKYL